MGAGTTTASRRSRPVRRRIGCSPDEVGLLGNYSSRAPIRGGRRDCQSSPGSSNQTNTGKLSISCLDDVAEQSPRSRETHRHCRLWPSMAGCFDELVCASVSKAGLERTRCPPYAGRPEMSHPKAGCIRSPAQRASCQMTLEDGTKQRPWCCWRCCRWKRGNGLLAADSGSWNSLASSSPQLCAFQQ